MTLHADELDIPVDTVRRLVDRDVPALRGHPLRPFDSTGSSNRLLRLGDNHLVRLPRQPGGSATIEKEARWLPLLAPHLPAAVPEVVALGRPGFGYPERWAVTRWVDGQHPAVPTVPAPRASGDGLARDLAAFVRALRAVDVPAAAHDDPELSWYRAGDVHDLDADVRGWLEQCRGLPGLDLDLDAVRAVWDDAMTLPRAGGPPQWLHADLLAENLLVDADGRLAAVLDFGGLAVGHPDVDLVVAWEVLDAPARAAFRGEMGVEDASWWRGRAWALALAVMTFPYYWATMPGRCGARRVMARAVVADHARGSGY